MACSADGSTAVGDGLVVQRRRNEHRAARNLTRCELLVSTTVEMPRRRRGQGVTPDGGDSRASPAAWEGDGRGAGASGVGSVGALFRYREAAGFAAGGVPTVSDDAYDYVDHAARKLA